MTPEGKVKAKAVALLKAAGAYYFFPVTGGFGKSGVPDIVACVRGHFLGIECKAGKGKTTALQDFNLKQIGDAGGWPLIVNEENLGELEILLMMLP